MSTPPREITDLLLKWRGGDGTALDRLMSHVYEELRRIARHYLAAERPDHTFQSAAVINEVYLRLIDYRNVACQDRNHFFALAAQAMRRVLVDHARGRRTQKRGSGERKVPLDEAAGQASELSEELIVLDGALTVLAKLDPRKSRVVETRYFGGMTVEETAEVFGVAPLTVMRDWRAAKAWLFRSLTDGIPTASA